MKYIIEQSEDKQFYNVCLASNNKVISQTETMHRHHDVVKNIYSQMRGHGSSKLVKVVDYVTRTSYQLRLRGGKVEKFGEKKLRASE